MALVSMCVIDGIDKGKTFLNLRTPVTVGREEGNAIRLNDDRISRFHAKMQEDQGKVVLTDLDSTNGTRVNGEPVQLRLLRPGDRVTMGRSTLIFGTIEEITGLIRNGGLSEPHRQVFSEEGTCLVTEMSASRLDSALDLGDVFQRKLPELPLGLSPAQAAQLSEVIDFLHRALAEATEPVRIPEDSSLAHLPIESWNQIQLVLTYLARYSRHVAEPFESAE